MTAVNNFHLCAPFVPEVFDGDTFLYTELLDRSKRSGNNKGRIVRTYWHRTRADFLERAPDIIKLCDFTGARAYMRLTPRSFKMVGKEFAKIMLDQVLTENWEGMRHGYNRACGTTRIPTAKTWMWDIDHKFSDVLTEAVVAHPAYLVTIPSRKGRHLITRPFDVRELDVHYPKDICQKDNPTNLYIPEGA